MFTQILDGIINSLGLEGIALFILLASVSTICNIISRLIPDDATGWKAVVRKVAAVVGLYVSNRVTSGVTTNDVAKAVVEDVQAKDPKAAGTAIGKVAGPVLLDMLQNR